MPTRLIRDGILTSEAVASLSADEERFFMRLMLCADDYGLFDARPAIILTRAFPLQIDTIGIDDIKRWLDAIVNAGLVKLYSFGSKPYLEIVNFGQAKRTKPKFPRPTASEQHADNLQADCKQHADNLNATCKQIASNCLQNESIGEGEGGGGGEGGGEGGGAPAAPSSALPYPRSSEEVREYMSNLAICGLSGAEISECATRFFDTMEECGWRLKNGLPIADWRATARKYVTSWQSNISNVPFGCGSKERGRGKPPRLANAGCNDPRDYAQGGSKLSHDSNDPNAPF